MLARRWPAVLLLVIAGAFAWAVNAAVSDDDDLRAVDPLALATLFAVVFGLAAGALWALVPRVRALGATGVACLAGACALLAGLPVDFAYDDGCNAHTTVTPLVLLPALAVGRPERARGAYEDASTLKLCFAGPAAPFARTLRRHR